jgi:predicted NACHT family NTPase
MLNHQLVESYQDLLHVCFCALIRKHHSYQKEKEKAISEKARVLSDQLQSDIDHDSAIKELAKNPLLLTLLFVIAVDPQTAKQRSVQEQGVAKQLPAEEQRIVKRHPLPRQKIELYNIFTHVLLEGQSTARRLPPLPVTEEQAIRCLGQLAMKMKEEGSHTIPRRDVMYLLTQEIRAERYTNAAERKAEAVLKYIRERTGLFVRLTTDDEFGFFHSTFQDYFVARHMLNSIRLSPARGISQLVSKACDLDDSWLEPFRLAVAYQAYEGKAIANKIISRLLERLNDADSFGKRERILSLAFECVCQVRAFTFDNDVVQKIRQQIVLLHNEALQNCQHDSCQRIEAIMKNGCSMLHDLADPVLGDFVSQVQAYLEMHASQKTAE